MNNTQKTVYVYDDFSADEPVMLGRLSVDVIIAVTNSDDHLRNHAFLLKNNSWKLSPLYDVNPVPYGDELSLNVNETDNRISVDLVIETSVHFGISRPETERQAREILTQVKENWERLARWYGLSRNEIETMRPAFSECYK